MAGFGYPWLAPSFLHSQHIHLMPQLRIIQQLDYKHPVFKPPLVSGRSTSIRDLHTNIFGGFWLLFMGLVSLLFAICSVRINIVFVILFLGVAVALLLLTGSFWATAEDFTGNTGVAHRCEVVSLGLVLLCLAVLMQ
jgi:hypothetical protein